jgi:GTP:adenosylcobinamide-phosphate guanylyltransferase
MKAVITAGAYIDGEFAAAAGTRVKALAQVRGVTMLQRIIESLRAVGVDRLAVVGGEEVRNACAKLVECLVDETPSGGENLLRALRAWPPDDDVLLYATSDLPYVTADAVGAFASRVPAGTLAVAVTEFADFERRFPSGPPVGITLAGERVVNGGLFSLPDGSTERIAAIATRFFDARKQPWRMAGLVSPMILLRFLLGRLSISDLEAMALRVLEVPACAIRNCAPELAFDVDTAAEYRYACANA